MIALLWFIGAIALSIVILLILPCGTVNADVGCTTAFLPVPSGMTDALQSAGSYLKWSFYLYGDDIGDALVVVALSVLAIGTAALVWRLAKDLPIIRRFFG